MTPEIRPAAIYTMGLSTSETQRLITQASLYEPITERMLESAGITTGMRVLDVGTGAGDVALLAAARVGPTGSVTAIDTNPTILTTARLRASAAGLTNVTFLEADYRTLALDGGFDAAIGRLVLMYAPEPAAAIRAVVANAGRMVSWHFRSRTLPHCLATRPRVPHRLRIRCIRGSPTPSGTPGRTRWWARPYMLLSSRPAWVSRIWICALPWGAVPNGVGPLGC